MCQALLVRMKYFFNQHDDQHMTCMTNLAEILKIFIVKWGLVTFDHGRDLNIFNVDYLANFRFF